MPVAKVVGGEFKPAPAGTHLARCVGVVSLGTQLPGNPTFKPAFKVMIVWELPDEELVGDKALIVQKEYGCFLGDRATLRHDLEGWRGRPFTKEELDGFDVVKVLDKPCMLSIIHETSGKGTVYAKVKSVSSLPRGLQPKPRVNELVHYEIEQGRDATFQSLPKWIQDKIAKCEEWKTQSNVSNPSNEPDDPGDLAPEDVPPVDPEVGF